MYALLSTMVPQRRSPSGAGAVKRTGSGRSPSASASQTRRSRGRRAQRLGAVSQSGRPGRSISPTRSTARVRLADARSWRPRARRRPAPAPSPPPDRRSAGRRSAVAPPAETDSRSAPGSAGRTGRSPTQSWRSRSSIRFGPAAPGEVALGRKYGPAGRSPRCARHQVELLRPIHAHGDIGLAPQQVVGRVRGCSSMSISGSSARSRARIGRQDMMRHHDPARVIRTVPDSRASRPVGGKAQPRRRPRISSTPGTISGARLGQGEPRSAPRVKTVMPSAASAAGDLPAQRRLAETQLCRAAADSDPAPPPPERSGSMTSPRPLVHSYLNGTSCKYLSISIRYWHGIFLISSEQWRLP